MKKGATKSLKSRIESLGLTQKQIVGEMIDEGVLSRGTFYDRMRTGRWKPEEAAWLAKRLGGLSKAQLVGAENMPDPVDSELLTECYLMFTAALAERELIEDLAPERQAAAFAAWFKQCAAIGVADPAILDDWLRVFDA